MEKLHRAWKTQEKRNLTSDQILKKKKKNFWPRTHPNFCPNDLEWSDALVRSTTESQVISGKNVGV